MRWLVALQAKSARSKDGERGAIAVLAAVLMVAMVLVVALVVNVGIAYAEKAQLQNGADAAALAVAGECAKRVGTVDACIPGPVGGELKAIADSLVNSNSNDGSSSVLLEIGTEEVTATTSTVSGDGPKIILPISGVDATVRAVAAAKWGGIKSGTPIIPITFGACELDSVKYPLDGVDRAILTHSSSKCSSTGQPHSLPGGFGWLENDNCKTIITVGQWAKSDNGNNIECEDLFTASLIGKTVLLPIFDETRDKDKEFHISGWGVFILKGFFLKGGSAVGEWASDGPGKSDRGLYGHFIEQISFSEGFTWGEPGIYGVNQVKLTK
ncbi:pilus assembly protein TadG-related protein [Arthrobacter sp. TWP1-1]|uniref:pilus assembly protein TadG-related protein n=1 Tax=Arthrobacter sp. TWP1-1 TaxID=2804568 RepID=UPI003CF81C83